MFGPVTSHRRLDSERLQSLATEAAAALRHGFLDHGVAAALDLETAMLDEVRARPAAFGGALGQAGRDVDPGQGIGGARNGLAGIERAVVRSRDAQTSAARAGAPAWVTLTATSCRLGRVSGRRRPASGDG